MTGIKMKNLSRCLVYCIFATTACDKGPYNKKICNVDHNHQEINKTLTETDVAFALWYSYQHEAFVATRSLLNKDYGLVHNGRDPSEIISVQRKVLDKLKPKSDARDPESKVVFERWLNCQIEAAGCLADVLGITQCNKGKTPKNLLDMQDEAISLIKEELKRRGENYWN